MNALPQIKFKQHRNLSLQIHKTENESPTQSLIPTLWEFQASMKHADRGDRKIVYFNYKNNKSYTSSFLAETGEGPTPNIREIVVKTNVVKSTIG